MLVADLLSDYIKDGDADWPVVFAGSAGSDTLRLSRLPLRS